MNGLDPLFAAAHFDALLNGHTQGGQDSGAQLSAFSQDELSWLEQQLSFASPPSHPALPATGSTSSTTASSSGNGTPASTAIPLQPHAFPPVSQARFHPYQLPPERAQRVLRPPGPHAQLNLLSSAAQLQQLALEQQQQQERQHQQRPQQQQSSASNGLAVPGYQSNGTIDGIDWAAFGSFGSAPTSPFSGPTAVATVPHPPLQQSYQQQVQHQQQLALSFGNSAAAASPRHSRPRPPGPLRQASTASSTSTQSNGYEAPHHVLYPPANSPPTVLLPDLPTPPLPPAPHASPATPRTNYSASSPAAGPSGLANEVSMRDGETVSGVPKRKRARSAPPPPRVRHSVGPPGVETPGDTEEAFEARSEQLDALFTWLDDQRWSFSTLFTALSEVSSSSSSSDSSAQTLLPPVALSHRRRMEDFLAIDEPLFSAAAATGSTSKQGTDLGLRLLREARKRWTERAANGDGTVSEKGPNEVVRMWEEMGALGRGEGSMAHAVRELHSHVHDGAVAGSVIRNITNRYGEAYAEANSDIKRLDDALSRPLDPHVTSAPREASVWTGTLVIPTLQADVLQAWLSSNPARQEAQRKEGGQQSKKIDPEHMRIYSSLSPLDFHARGAELCRVILLRDADCMQRFGHVFDRLQTFTLGPVIALVDTCGFSTYDDQSLWHHAVQTYLQLCVRYPELTEGKEATITILPDLPPPVHPTALETLLIDRALHSHWDALRQFLLDAHGGLLRSAVRSFSGVRLTKFDLLSVCDDTMAVITALDKSRTSRKDRILPYDPSISQIRNAWRQQALWDPTADLVVWSAATTHFLELSALYPQIGRGVRELPGLGSMLDHATSGQSPPKVNGKAGR